MSDLHFWKKILMAWLEWLVNSTSYQINSSNCIFLNWFRNLDPSVVKIKYLFKSVPLMKHIEIL